jgi:hypothetical protein
MLRAFLVGKGYEVATEATGGEVHPVLRGLGVRAEDGRELARV